jgi:hypothetical protein
MDKYLCSFKCPFCEDRAEVTTEIQIDGWTKVQGYCDGQTDKLCGIGFDFGTFGEGFTRQEMKESVMEVVGIRFIN